MKKGIDSPGTLIGIVIGAIFVIMWAIGTMQWYAWIIALCMAFSAFTYFHTTWYGKYKTVKKAVSNLKIAPEAQVLDLGTGHGVLLLEVAQHLTMPGKVTGIDIWSKKDQSNNSIAATKQNIKQAGYEQVTDLVTANMLDLPFEDNSFDKITASFSIHNIQSKEDRAKALAEVKRVLKPNGQILIIDLIFGPEYQQVLNDLDFKNISLKSAGYDGWWGGPWMMSTVLTATKN